MLVQTNPFDQNALELPGSHKTCHAGVNRGQPETNLLQNGGSMATKFGQKNHPDNSVMHCWSQRYL